MLLETGAEELDVLVSGDEDLGVELAGEDLGPEEAGAELLGVLVTGEDDLGPDEEGELAGELDFGPED